MRLRNLPSGGEPINVTCLVRRDFALWLIPSFPQNRGFHARHQPTLKRHLNAIESMTHTKAG
jgi:hypothetical protein